MGEIRGATWDDLEDVYELLDARSRAAFGISELRFEHLRDRWQLPAFAVGLDNWVARENGRIVGYAAVDAAQELEHAAKDAATGDALLARAEERARERGFDTLTTTVVPEDEPLQSLVGRAGFSRDREVLRMWRRLDGDLPEPRWPSGVSVRAYEAADSERVHAFLDEAYAGWDREYVLLPHDEWVAFMTGHDEFDPALLVPRGARRRARRVRAALEAAAGGRLGEGPGRPQRRARRRAREGAAPARLPRVRASAAPPGSA